MAGYFAGQLIDEMIGTRALILEAKRMGLEVTDAELARALRTNFPMLFPNGQFVGKEAYSAMLQQQGRTIPEFEAQLREQLLMGRLANLVNDGVIVTPADVEKQYRRRNDKVKLAYIAFSPDKYRSQANVAPAAIQSYFSTSRGEFQVPEKRSLDVLTADEAGIGQKVTLAEADVRRAYDQNREQFRVPERVHVRHVLLKTSGKPKEEAPKLLARANDLLKQLKAGGDFAEIAKKNSEDPASAAKGGDLGWVARGQTVPAFESTAFSLKPNELSGIVTTEYGYHILQLIEKEQGHVRSFDEVKDQISQEMKRQMVFEALQREVDQAHDELVKQPLKAAEIAARHGLNVVHVASVAPGQQIPEIGSTPEFSDAIAALAKSGVSQVVQLPGNKLAIAVVTDVQPARPAQLAEVEGQIRERLSSQMGADLAGQRAAEAAEKLKASGGDLKMVAQQMGLEVKTTQEFGRDGAADGIGPGASLTAAFEQPVGSVFGPVLVENQRFLCKVESRKDADLSQLTPAVREELRTEIRQNKGKQEVELFMDSIRNSLLRQGKIKIHKDVMNQVIATYRG